MSHVGLQDINSGSGLRVLCSRTAVCALPRWAWVPAVVSPGLR